MSPVIVVLFTEYQYSMDFTDFFPTDSSSVNAWNQMVDDFPASTLMPYYILATANGPVNDSEDTSISPTIWTKEFFRSMCSATNVLMDHFDIPSIYFHSAMYAPNITFNVTNPKDPTFNISMDEIFCFDGNVTYKNTTYSMVETIKYLYQNGSDNPMFNSSVYYQYADTYLQSMIRHEMHTFFT